MGRITASFAATVAVVAAVLGAVPVASGAGIGSATAAVQAAASATPLYSPNWGGYLAVAPAGQHVEYVGALTTVPKVNCKHSIGQRPYMAAEWVGMDGYGNLAPGPHNGLEQAGIVEYCQNQNSTPEYDAFWEMFPDPMHIFGQVKPGDEVVMAVGGPSDNPYPGKFQLTVEDGATYYATSATPPKGTIGYQHTAEVVTERPAWNGHLSGLLDTGKMTYTQTSYILSSGKQSAVTQHPVWNLRIMPSLPWSSRQWYLKDDDFSTSIGTWQVYVG